MNKISIMNKLYIIKEKFSLIFNIVNGLFGGIGIGMIFTGLMFAYSNYLNDNIQATLDYKSTFTNIFSYIGLGILACYFLLNIFIKNYIYKKRKKDYFYFLNRGLSNKLIFYSLFLEDIALNLCLLISSIISSILIFKYVPNLMNDQFILELSFNKKMPVLETFFVILTLFLINIISSYFTLINKKALKSFKEEN